MHTLLLSEHKAIMMIPRRDFFDERESCLLEQGSGDTFLDDIIRLRSDVIVGIFPVDDKRFPPFPKHTRNFRRERFPLLKLEKYVRRNDRIHACTREPGAARLFEVTGDNLDVLECLRSRGIDEPLQKLALDINGIHPSHGTDIGCRLKLMMSRACTEIRDPMSRKEP